MKFDKGLMAGSTTMMILSLLEGSDMYGYQMIEELARRSNDTFQMKEGTLYPILRALENEGAVESYQTATEGGRKRKYYHLTDRGRKQLAAETAEWRKYEHAINAVLSMG